MRHKLKIETMVNNLLAPHNLVNCGIGYTQDGRDMLSMRPNLFQYQQNFDKAKKILEDSNQFNIQTVSSAWIIIHRKEEKIEETEEKVTETCEPSIS